MKRHPDHMDYIIHSDGRIYSTKGYGRYLKPSLTEKGYESVTLMGVSGKKKYRVHRLVAEVYIPNPNKYPYVLHNDGNKLNNCVSNLRWGNDKMNYADYFIDHHMAPDQKKAVNILKKFFSDSKIETLLDLPPDVVSRF